MYKIYRETKDIKQDIPSKMSNLIEANGGIFHILKGVLGGKGVKISNKRKS